MLPLTDWSGNMPEYNVWGYLAFLGLWLLFTATFISFNNSTYDPPPPATPHDGWRYAWKASFVAMVLVGSTIVAVILVIPALSGFDFHFCK